MSYSPEAQQFFDRIADPGEARKNLYAALIDSLVVDGIWANLDALYVFAAPIAATALTNLKSSSFGASESSSPTFTADVGYAVGQSTGLVSTGYNPSSAGGNYTQNDASFGGWVLAADAVQNSILMTDPNANVIWPRWTDDTLYATINGTNDDSIAASTDASGFWALDRAASSGFTVYRNGSSFDTHTQTSASLDNNVFVVGYSLSNAAITIQVAFIGGSLGATAQGDFYTAVNTFLAGILPTGPTVANWIKSFSEPTRRIARTALTVGALTAPVFVPTETVTIDKWYRPLSEPVRFKAKVPVQQVIAQVVLSDRQLTDTFESRWHQPWSEPVRKKPGLLASLQKTTEIDPFPRPPESLTVGSWLSPFSAPVRHKSGLGAWLKQFSAIDPYSLTQPERISEDKWHQPWSEPTRRRGIWAASQQFIIQSFTPDPARDAISWYQQLKDPTLRRGLWPSYQQASIQGVVPDPFGFQIGWYEQFSDPTRRVWKPTFQTAYFANPETPAPTAVFLEWYQNFTDPVRPKLGLRAELQHVSSGNIYPIIPTQSSWFEAYSEPIRLNLKIGVKAWLQQFFTADTSTPALPTVTVTLDATEINADVFTSAIVVTDEPPPSLPDPYALVSIVEVSGSLNTPSSIVET